MKQMFAWAIVGPDDKLVLIDGQCPIYWLRRVAVRTMSERGLSDNHSVVRVTVRPVHRP
jgi:hypothetical protein